MPDAAFLSFVRDSYESEIYNLFQKIAAEKVRQGTAGGVHFDWMPVLHETFDRVEENGPSAVGLESIRFNSTD
jgi:hypothetical protein